MKTLYLSDFLLYTRPPPPYRGRRVNQFISYIDVTDASFHLNHPNMFCVIQFQAKTRADIF